MKITVECGGCSKRFQADEKHAGKRGKCPSCGALIEVPVPVPAAPEPVADEVGSLLDEELPTASAPSAQPATGMEFDSCPSCAEPLPSGAALCVSCGYDLASGKQLKTERVLDSGGPYASPLSGSKGTGWSLPRLGGSFLTGCILSAVGAAIGAAVWYGVAVATEYEIGWIAWGLGVLAGIGMVWGSGEENDLTGIMAAVIACLGILLAKYLMFRHFVEPLPEVRQLVAMQVSKVSLFFKTMFGPIDGIFILLAVASAYKIGNASPVD